MRIADVQHQDAAIDMIGRSLRSERTPHAYIFAGPDGIGKELAATCLAAALLCPRAADDEAGVFADASAASENLAVDSCGTCASCTDVAHGTHPDVHVIHRRLNKVHPKEKVRKRKAIDLGVDVVREFVIERAGLKPVRGHAKVFIVREADRITAGAQNALLKTLEEPPDKTYIVLLATNTANLLQTTNSRCQVINFALLPAAFIAERLAKAHPHVPPEQIRWYGQNAGGSLGQGLAAIAQEMHAWNNVVAKSIVELDGASVESVIERWTQGAKQLGQHYRKADPEISDTEATRRGLQTTFALAAGLLADIMRLGAGALHVTNADHSSKLQELAGRLGQESLAEMIERLGAAERHLNFNANTQLVVEVLLNELTQCLVADATHA